MTTEIQITQCYNCGNRTAFKIIGTCAYQDELATEIFDLTTWRLMQCLTCEQPTLEQTEKVYKNNTHYSEDFGLIESEEVITGPETTILYPTSKREAIPPPAKDMPNDVSEDFQEARNVFGVSPRSSAALLRLALQKLCIHLGQSGERLNDDIGALVNKGMPIEVQQALDIVRVIGNNAVHPGLIDIRDDPETAIYLFDLLNFIVETTITRPNKIKEIYNKLPENVRKSIDDRKK